MSGSEDLQARVARSEADRLFREEASRRPPEGDSRLLPWIGSAKPGSRWDVIGSLVSTAFGVFCLVGGLSMMLGMTLIPAMGVSLLVFAAVRVFMNVG